MKCAAHNSEAVAVCAYCGRALCADCAKSSATGRMTCSDNCADALARNDKALRLILQKSLQSARASAFYCYLCGGLSLAAAVGAKFYLPSPFLIWFTAGCGAIFIASGFWYGRIARKQTGGSPD
jgi:predicted nucleic acid-binding Zn ribbon protein